MKQAYHAMLYGIANTEIYFFFYSTYCLMNLHNVCDYNYIFDEQAPDNLTRALSINKIFIWIHVFPQHTKEILLVSILIGIKHLTLLKTKKEKTL